MANTAHLVRRQSSRDLGPQRSLDSVELKQLKTKMLMENGGMKSQSYAGQSMKQSYGATNRGFDDTVAPITVSIHVGRLDQLIIIIIISSPWVLSFFGGGGG